MMQPDYFSSVCLAMRGFLVCSLVISLTTAGPQKINFGGSGSSSSSSSSGSGSSSSSSSSGSGSGSVNTRLGLLATQLGLDPTASQGSQGASSGGFSNRW